MRHDIFVDTLAVLVLSERSRIERPCAACARAIFFCPKRSLMEAVTYCNEDAIREVVEKFETCIYAPEEFIHARHLTVAAWYLCRLPEDVALHRMRQSLLRFTAHHGKQGYHETITRFWMLLIAEHLRRQDPELSD